MNNRTLLIILFVAVIAAAGLFGLYLRKQPAAALSAPPADSFEASDTAAYQAMLAVFKQADAGGQWDWMQEWVGKQYKGPGKLTLVNGKRTKTAAFMDVYSRMFYDFAEGGPKAGQVNDGKGYPLAGGYTWQTLAAELWKMWMDYKSRNEYGI